MNVNLFEYAKAQLAALHAAAAAESGDCDAVLSQEEPCRLAKFAAYVVAGVKGTGAEPKLKELADKCRTLLGPGSRFHELREQAVVHLAMGRRACGLATEWTSRPVSPQEAEGERDLRVRCLARFMTVPEAWGQSRSQEPVRGILIHSVWPYANQLDAAGRTFGDPEELLLGLDDAIGTLDHLGFLMMRAGDALSPSLDPEDPYYSPFGDDSETGSDSPAPAESEGGEASRQEEAATEAAEDELGREGCRVFSVAREMSEILDRCDAENLRGAWFIMRCSEAFGQRESQPEAFGRFLGRTGRWPWSRTAGLVSSAAEELGAFIQECQLGEGGVPDVPNGGPGIAIVAVGKDDPWHRMDEEPPPDCWDIPLVAREQEPIIWALFDARMIEAYSPKVLKGKLKRGLFWGRKAGRNYAVFPKKLFREEQVRDAARRLEEIKNRGPWHHPEHQKPNKYARFHQRPLEHRDPAVLAQVMHAAGIGGQATGEAGLPALHRSMRSGGLLYGVYDAGRYLLYLDNDVPEDAVDRAHSMLRERAETPPTGPD